MRTTWPHLGHRYVDDQLCALGKHHGKSQLLLLIPFAPGPHSTPTFRDFIRDNVSTPGEERGVLYWMVSRRVVHRRCFVKARRYWGPSSTSGWNCWKLADEEFSSYVTPIKTAVFDSTVVTFLPSCGVYSRTKTHKVQSLPSINPDFRFSRL